MDHADPTPFAERLMDSEPGDDDLRRRYEGAKRALLERRIDPRPLRLNWWALPLYGLLAVAGGYRLLAAGPAEPRALSALIAVGTAGVLALGLWSLRVLLRGGRVTRRDDRALEWLGGLGLCALSWALFEFAGSLEDAGAARRLSGLSGVLLMGGVLGVLLERVRRSELETRVKLVELKLRVAELSQAVAPPPPGAPPPRP